MVNRNLLALLPCLAVLAGCWEAREKEDVVESAIEADCVVPSDGTPKGYERFVVSSHDVGIEPELKVFANFCSSEIRLVFFESATLQRIDRAFSNVPEMKEIGTRIAVFDLKVERVKLGDGLALLVSDVGDPYPVVRSQDGFQMAQ